MPCWNRPYELPGSWRLSKHHARIACDMGEKAGEHSLPSCSAHTCTCTRNPVQPPPDAQCRSRVIASQCSELRVSRFRTRRSSGRNLQSFGLAELVRAADGEGGPRLWLRRRRRQQKRRWQGLSDRGLLPGAGSQTYSSCGRLVVSDFLMRKSIEARQRVQGELKPSVQRRLTLYQASQD